MKQHACLENTKQFHFSGAQGTRGRDVGNGTQERRRSQVIRSLGCQANGFELHPKTFGMSLKDFKQGRGILRSHLHFITVALAE